MEPGPRYEVTRGLVHVIVALGFLALFMLVFPGPSQAAVPTAVPAAVPAVVP